MRQIEIRKIKLAKFAAALKKKKEKKRLKKLALAKKKQRRRQKRLARIKRALLEGTKLKYLSKDAMQLTIKMHEETILKLREEIFSLRSLLNATRN